MAMSFDSDRSDVNESAFIAAVKTISTSQIEACALSSSLDNRQAISIYNNGPQIIYYGPSGITSNTGIPIFKNQLVSLPLGPNNRAYLITSSSSSTAVIQEMS